MKKHNKRVHIKQGESKKEINKYGLTRIIPPDVKLEVRKRCGFGCVICGSGLFQYEHFDPPFFDCNEHNPTGITLLCGGCHDKKTRGHLAVNTIKRANSNPRANIRGFSNGEFDIGEECPSVYLGSFMIHNTENIIRFHGEDILSISQPESEDGPYLLSGRIRDSKGKIIFEIEKNEWKSFKGNWDANVVGQTFTIRSKKYKVEMKFTVQPPNLVRVERLNMFHRGYQFNCSDNLFQIIGPNNWRFNSYNATMRNCGTAIEIYENGDVGIGQNGGELYLGNVEIISGHP